jgi:cytochrome c-type biogenesis protein CcmF
MQGLSSSITSALATIAPALPREPIDVLEDRFSPSLSATEGIVAWFQSLKALPAFGTLGLHAIIVFAALAFAISVAAARRPRLLGAARSAAYATCALVVFDLLLLAYAFVTHDFRIRYVARYSDRSMSTGYLLTALWGGQDGSLLWWVFLLSANTAACLWWMGRKWRELQPYVIATLMGVLGFFALIMTFSANPFAESIAGARVDGEGLNPLLQNFYMIIHPPSLYTGFVGCTVPFAFCVAALATGRLGEEWLAATRKWMLFAWLFLSIGNVLGMLWAYEELGWGGYWAWDPVENAAFMPWLTASAFVHSTMIQERRRILKVWNVFLITQTFFMTIFGTFLTRAGLIASVHAFAQSSIGIYFTYLMFAVAVVAAAMILFRLPELRNLDVDEAGVRLYREKVGPVLARGFAITCVLAVAVRLSTDKMWALGVLAVAAISVGAGYAFARLRRTFPGHPWGDGRMSIVLVAVMPPTALGVCTFWIAHRVIPEATVAPAARERQAASAAYIDALESREAAFVANNWVLLSMQAFILLTTTFPLVSEAVAGEKVTVGPAFYNRWMVPFGLALFALMGIGPLLGWRKTSPGALRKAFRIPLAATAAAAALHVALGGAIGFPAFVPSDPIYPGELGRILAVVSGGIPILATALCAFNAAVIIQEYQRGIAARRKKNGESFFVALVQLVARARRRYGGYVVHAGILLMFLGFTGAAYKVDQEFALRPGETVHFAGYDLTYLGPRRIDTDPAKMEIYTDVAVRKDGRDLGVLHPARFVYRRQQMPTSEVAIRTGLREDLYLAPGTVNPDTKLATIHVYVNPLTLWIWVGALVLILGAAISLWPDPETEEVGVAAYLRTAGAVAASLAFGIILALTPARAFAQTGGSSSLHAGHVEMKSAEERQIFSNLLCLCGGCDRLPLSNCACSWADGMRTRIRERLGAGETVTAITEWYVSEHGTAALNVPPSRGFLRSIWLVPAVLVMFGGAGAVFMVRAWAKKPPKKPTAGKGGAGGENDDRPRPTDDYDRKLDDELSDDR